MQFLRALIQFVFTSYELMWFIIGGLTFLSIYVINQNLKVSNRGTKLISFSVVSAILLVDLAVLWMVESIFENEMKAAMMGVTIFGALGIGFGILAYKLVKN